MGQNQKKRRKTPAKQARISQNLIYAALKQGSARSLQRFTVQDGMVVGTHEVYIDEEAE